MPRPQPPPSTKPFPDALADLAEYVGISTHRRTGEVNVAALYEAIGGRKAIGTDMTLRRLMHGTKTPTIEYMRIIADGLGVDPAYFVEWRLYEARSAFDPDIVGLETALANWQAWAERGHIPATSKSGSRARR